MQQKPKMLRRLFIKTVEITTQLKYEGYHNEIVALKLNLKKKKKSYLFNELKWYVSLVMFYEMLRVFNCATDAARIEKFPVTMFEILTFCR